MARVTRNHRILTCDGRETEFSSGTAINLSDDTVFQFLSEECEGLSSIFDDDADDDEKENQNENEIRGAEDDNFWETQHQLLQVSFFWKFSFCLNRLKQNKFVLYFEEDGNSNSFPAEICEMANFG